MSYNVVVAIYDSERGIKMAVASLVLGICALVFPFIGFGWLSVLVGIVGIILGAMARKKETGKGMATAGLVMSMIAVVLGLIMWIACAACVGGLAAASTELANEIASIS